MLQRRLQMAQKYCINRLYEYDTKDLAVAFLAVATERYGPDALAGLRSGWFSRSPLNLVSIKTDHNTQKTGVMGLLAIPKIRAEFLVGVSGNEESPTVSVFNVVPENREEVERFLDEIKAHLDQHSIYRGKAISSSGEFLDLSSISPDDTVYNEKILRDLRAHVWTVIEHAEKCSAVKVGLPRRVLFEGPYGSGKSLAALLTAQKALGRAWTFFYVTPTAGNAVGVVRHMLAFARRYQPAVVFIEDIDREQRAGNDYELGAIMAEVDGIASKGGEILIVMTTNHNDKISQGMCRPGRIDKVIHFGTFTALDIERLLRKIIPTDWLGASLDWPAITNACKGFSAAFVCEVGKAAMLLAMSENPEGKPVITSDFLIEAANDLEEQHKKSNGKIGF